MDRFVKKRVEVVDLTADDPPASTSAPSTTESISPSRAVAQPDLTREPQLLALVGAEVTYYKRIFTREESSRHLRCDI